MRFGRQNFSLGDFSSDFGQVSTDLQAGNYSQMFSDPISGLPLWTWLAGGTILYLFFFSGGSDHSRVGRAGRAARRGYQAAKAAY